LAKTFAGGVHPPYNKLTGSKPVERATTPSVVKIPCSQHIGAPAEFIVQVGDRVLVGQKIAEAKAFVCSPVHSSVSGTVVGFEQVTHPTGSRPMAAVIENDGQYELDPSIQPKGTIETLSPAEIVAIVKEAGIVGMGGATFPAHVKMSPPPDKSADTIIVNGAECEPYLTSDHRTMVENAADLVYGLRLIMKGTGVKKGVIGIEVNKPDAIAAVNAQIEKFRGEDKEGVDISVLPLAAKYPQGSEKQIINTVTGRQVPSGGLPVDAGVMVFNASTCAAVANAVLRGMPLIERIVTVTGPGVVEPKNLLARFGTPYMDLVQQCGGFKGLPGKVISGGPMMGLAQYDVYMPVIKGTSGILVLDKPNAKKFEETACIKCGKCVAGCPIGLVPLKIADASIHNNLAVAEQFHAMDCIECGSCSYICPAKRPLVQAIRLAKNQIAANRRKKS